MGRRDPRLSLNVYTLVSEVGVRTLSSGEDIRFNT